MVINPRSLENLRPRVRSNAQKEPLKVYLPSEYKYWLKESNASHKIEILIDLYLQLLLLLTKTENEFSGYKANNFSKGLKDLKDIKRLLESIKKG